MVIRGAPAIGVAASHGCGPRCSGFEAKNLEGLRSDFEQITKVLASTRPTAVNLFWAIERMKRLFKELAGRRRWIDGRSPTSSSGKRSRFRPKTSKTTSAWAASAKHLLPDSEPC